MPPLRGCLLRILEVNQDVGSLEGDVEVEGAEVEEDEAGEVGEVGEAGKEVPNRITSRSKFKLGSQRPNLKLRVWCRVCIELRAGPKRPRE
jgi:hypothetical protein